MGTEVKGRNGGWKISLAGDGVRTFHLQFMLPHTTFMKDDDPKDNRAKYGHDRTGRAKDMAKSKGISPAL